MPTRSACSAKSIVLADKGLAGRAIERYAAEQIGVLLVRPDRKDEKRRYGNLGGMRQWIEAIFGTTKDQLSLEHHRARTPTGVYTRIAQRLLALAAVIWHNWKINAPVKRSLIADEQLVRLERWITQTLEDEPDADRRHLLHHYAIWHLLLRLRTRNRSRPTTYGQATSIRQHVRSALGLLDWLAAQQLTFATCQRADLDRWLVGEQTTYARQASHFLRWATRTHHTASRLQGVAYRWGGPSAPIDGEQRWDTARRLLHDDTLKPEDRVAGLLVALYAQRAASISTLTTADVDTEGTVVRLRLGATPVELPEPLATLMRTLVATRTGHATIGEQGSSRWLFPGGQPSRPVSAAQMGQRLRGLGLRPHPTALPPCSAWPPNFPPRSWPACSASPSTSPSTGSTQLPETGAPTPPRSADEPGRALTGESAPQRATSLIAGGFPSYPRCHQRPSWNRQDHTRARDRVSSGVPGNLP